MLRKITREVLEGYLDCKYKAYLKLTGEQGTISEYEQLTKEITILIHETATDKLNARHRKTATETINRLDRAVLKQGLPLLLGPIFQNAKMSVRFDTLQKAPGESSLGDFPYIPVLLGENNLWQYGHRFPRILVSLRHWNDSNHTSQRKKRTKRNEKEKDLYFSVGLKNSNEKEGILRSVLTSYESITTIFGTVSFATNSQSLVFRAD